MFIQADSSVVSNPFSLIGKEKLLIASGDPGDYNVMTASWGLMGVLWNRNVINVVVRPQRYTFEYLEKNQFFTVSVLSEGFDSAYRVCGTMSGRDGDKAAAAGLHPVSVDHGVSFQEAKLVLVCRKIYVQDLASNCFVDASLDEKNYAQKDYHRMYCGEILSILTAQPE